MTFSNYINDLLKYGKCCFTIEDAQKTLNKSRNAIILSIGHLLKEGKLASPAKGFYVIIPPEYQKLGCIPAEHFMPYFMQYSGLRYYAGLLTAARYHGASHQAAQVFQIMIEEHKPPLTCGKIKVEFIQNKHLAEIPVEIVTTPKSKLTISTAEATAMDLLNYPHQSGGLNHIATVLSELQEAMHADKLQELAENQPMIAWQQRLGYLLEKADAQKLAETLKNHLAKYKRLDYIPLMPGLKKSSKDARNQVWKIIENATVESDI